MMKTKNINSLDTEQNFKFASSLIQVIVFIIGLMILVTSRYAFIFFLTAMLPTIFAFFWDRNKHKCALATICTFNLIGILPHLMRMWDSSNNVNHTAKLIMANIDTWIIVYGAAFVGQLLYISLPILITKIYEARVRAQILTLETRIGSLSEEWGIADATEEGGDRIGDK
jgi:hypothetical protein